MRRIALLGMIAFVVGLFVGGAQPVAVGLFKPPWDKLAHVVAFGSFAVLVELALRPRVAVLIGLPMLVSALDEIHQIWLPGRSAGLDDWLAGGVGVLLVFVLLRHTSLGKVVDFLRGRPGSD